MPVMIYEEPPPLTHCEECGAPLVGERTEHRAGCPWLDVKRRGAEIERFLAGLAEEELGA